MFNSEENGITLLKTFHLLIIVSEQVLNPHIIGKLPSRDINIHQPKNICFSGSCRHNLCITHVFVETFPIL